MFSNRSKLLSASLQQRILDNLATALVVLDSKLVITYLNPAAEILFETSSKQICGQTCDQLFFENENTAQELMLALKGGHPFTKREAVIHSVPSSQLTGSYSNSQITVNYSVSLLQNPTEQDFLLLEFQSLDRLLKISRDEALLNNQQATKALLRGMAHEVKNPLGGIKGAAQLLSRELSNDGQKEYISIIIEEADRLRNLVDRMLGPRTIPEIKAHNIYEVLEHICHIAEADSGRQVQLVRDYDPSIPEILIDRELLIQACLNIIGNACQVLLENNINHPKIIIRTRILRQFTIASKRHRMVLKIDFIDNGPGIPEDIKETLFYPMVSGRAQGTGLGLSIAQSIVNQFEGIIECESVPGQTCFSLLLPLSDKAEHEEIQIR